MFTQYDAHDTTQYDALDITHYDILDKTQYDALDITHHDILDITQYVALDTQYLACVRCPRVSPHTRQMECQARGDQEQQQRSHHVNVSDH